MAAVPGTSIHGWGRAVDLQDPTGKMTFDSPGYRWLQANAWRFGFVHPAWAEPGGSAPEPWHWEHG
jgi:LAS superfamily LD-carboxypeptidase LdcB